MTTMEPYSINELGGLITVVAGAVATVLFALQKSKVIYRELGTNASIFCVSREVQAAIRLGKDGAFGLSFVCICRARRALLH